MEFGPVPADDATGAVLAHSVHIEGGRLRKGLVLSSEHITQIKQAGHTEITVARLGADDVAENDAAAMLANALVPDAKTAGLRIGPAGTGRCNIFAQTPGVAQIDAAAIDAVNAVHPMITVATVPCHARMGAGGMLATVKIISYGVPRVSLAAASAAAQNALSLARPTRTKVAFFETMLDTPPSDKGAKSIAGRVAALGGTFTHGGCCAHDAGALATLLKEAKGDLILILTASATSDIHDTAPQAVVEAGGAVTHFGMPVDPGNLLFIGDLNGRPVIGLPGCARSPALNGADWVLERLICGIDVTARDIMGMGVGGLLKEIPTRPQPRKPVSP